MTTARSARRRPYPNVRATNSNSGRWEASRPSNGTFEYLGTFDSPEAARCAVLIAQAEHLEAKAAAYRAQAECVGNQQQWKEPT